MNWSDIFVCLYNKEIIDVNIYSLACGYTYFYINVYGPGWTISCRKAPSAATLEALNQKYGLDQPKIVQYKNYMVKLVQGDMGVSIKQRGRTVSSIISTGFKVSARVGGLGILLAILVEYLWAA